MERRNEADHATTRPGPGGPTVLGTRDPSASKRNVPARTADEETVTDRACGERKTGGGPTLRRYRGRGDAPPDRRRPPRVVAPLVAAEPSSTETTHT